MQAGPEPHRGGVSGEARAADGPSERDIIPTQGMLPLRTSRCLFGASLLNTNGSQALLLDI